MTTPRLEELRTSLRSESISWGELYELQTLAHLIDRDDVELLEAAGVPEFPETLVTASGITLTDPDDITAYQNGRLTIVSVYRGIATVEEAPPKDRCLIINYDECEYGAWEDRPDFCPDLGTTSDDEINTYRESACLDAQGAFEEQES